MHSIDQPRAETEHKPPRLLERRERGGERGAVRSVTKFTYDDQRRLIQEERRVGVGDPPFGTVTISYTYDTMGRCTHEHRTIVRNRRGAGSDEPLQLAHEGEFEQVYDGDTDRVVMASYKEGAYVSWVQENEHDTQGRLVRSRRTDFSDLRSDRSPREHIAEFDYDEQGRVIEHRSLDEDRGLWYRTTYDQNGRPSREERGEIGSPKHFGIVTYQYTGDGRVVTQRNVYQGEPQWVSRDRKDEFGNTVEHRFASYRSGEEEHVSTTIYEFTYAPD